MIRSLPSEKYELTNRNHIEDLVSGASGYKITKLLSAGDRVNTAVSCKEVGEGA